MRKLASLAALAALSGCATIFTGTNDTLTFSSNVPGVRLSLDGEYRGELPLTVKMSRSFMSGQQFIAKFERQGYVTQELRLKREFNMVAILDVSSVPTSPVVDVLTGAFLRFSPTEYQVQMLAVGGSKDSTVFQRSTAVRGYALANYRSIQKDIARGGGEHLSSFAVALCGGAGGPSARVSAEAVRTAGPLLAAPTAPDFVAQFDRMLADSPALSAYRM